MARFSALFLLVVTKVIGRQTLNLKHICPMRSIVLLAVAPLIILPTVAGAQSKLVSPPQIAPTRAPPQPPAPSPREREGRPPAQKNQEGDNDRRGTADAPLIVEMHYIGPVHLRFLQNLTACPSDRLPFGREFAEELPILASLNFVYEPLVIPQTEDGRDIYLVTLAKYTDLASRSHETSVCRVYKSASDGFVPYGGDEYNYAT